MNAQEIEGYVGGITKRPNIIFIAQDRRGGTWYVAQGGVTVNLTVEDVTDGTWIDELSDIDCFTVNEPIETLEEFEAHLENM